jgi:hypothetical protein
MMIIELYRGLMNILVQQNLQFERNLIEHIRPFHKVRELQPGESGFFNGFWNFMLEVSMILFSKFIFVTGIILVLMLAIIFFPLNFVINVSTFAAKDGDRQLRETQLDLQSKDIPMGEYIPMKDEKPAVKEKK